MEMTKLDFKSTEPYYVQLANMIEGEIISKKIQVGDKLPNEEDLSKNFNVCNYTVAYR